MMRLTLGLGPFVYPVGPSFPSRFELIWLSGATAGGTPDGALGVAASLFLSSTLAPKSCDARLASPSRTRRVVPARGIGTPVRSLLRQRTFIGNNEEIPCEVLEARSGRLEHAMLIAVHTVALAFEHCTDLVAVLRLPYLA